MEWHLVESSVQTNDGYTFESQARVMASFHWDGMQMRNACELTFNGKNVKVQKKSVFSEQS